MFRTMFVRMHEVYWFTPIFLNVIYIPWKSRKTCFFKVSWTYKRDLASNPVSKDGKARSEFYLDLANVFGSAPRSLLWDAVEYFEVPSTVSGLVKKIFPRYSFVFYDIWIYNKLADVGSSDHGKVHNIYSVFFKQWRWTLLLELQSGL